MAMKMISWPMDPRPYDVGDPDAVADVAPRKAPRLAGRGASPRAWHEVYLNEVQAGRAASVKDSVAAGHSLIVIEAVSSAAECASLARAAAVGAANEREQRGIECGAEVFDVGEGADDDNVEQDERERHHVAQLRPGLALARVVLR